MCNRISSRTFIVIKIPRIEKKPASVGRMTYPRLSYRMTPPVTHLRDPTFDTGADPWNDTISNVN